VAVSYDTISGMKRTRYTPNIYVEKDNYYEMIIFSSEKRGCKELCRGKVSYEDLPRIAKYKWGIDGKGYIRNKQIKLHQFILGKKPNSEIDHINGDILDNRIDNLRFVTHQQNMQNIKKKNKQVGVWWDKNRLKWVATITVNYKNKVLGRFDNKEDAIKKRKEAEKKYFI